MTYREALKKTAVFVPLSIVDRGLWRDLAEPAGELLVALVALVGRLGAFATYPIAVPILAALVVAAERANERERVERVIRAECERPGYEPRELRAGDATTSP
jgi:hypothetical protein